MEMGGTVHHYTNKGMYIDRDVHRCEDGKNGSGGMPQFDILAEN